MGPSTGVQNREVSTLGESVIQAPTHQLTADQSLFNSASIFQQVLARMVSENQYQFSYIRLDWLVEIHGGECIPTFTGHGWRVA